jgi:CheY-like chemotaxis protein
MSQPARMDSASPLGGVRVVLVDDHAGVRDVISHLLARFGASVTAVSGVPEALEALEREQPDVLISDVEMPGEDGFALIRKLRALPPERGGEIPAVALTGLQSADARARILQAGFQSHVSKPVDARALTAVVTRLAARE